jgi:TolB protein
MANDDVESGGVLSAVIGRRRYHILFWSGLLLATAIATIAVVGSLRPGGQSNPLGKIAFVSNRDGNLEFYLVNSDGSALTNLSKSPGHDSSPAWAPNGTAIAFVSERAGLFDVFIARVDGSAPINLTSTPRPYYGGLSWSPDGARLAFYSRAEGLLLPGLSVINSDGSGMVSVSGTPTYRPTTSWSPDGDRIVISSGFEVGANIYVVNSDGTNLRRLTDVTHDSELLARMAIEQNVDRSALSAEYAEWSPDSRQIAFAIEAEGHSGVSGIYTLGANGSRLTQVTSNPESDLYPRWAPDGRSIAFISRHGSEVELQVVHLDGSGKMTLASQVGLENLLDLNAGPSWSPDGRQLAFVSGRDGNREIYVIDADGSSLRRLTNDPGSDFQPVWLPVRPK